MSLRGSSRQQMKQQSSPIIPLRQQDKIKKLQEQVAAELQEQELQLELIFGDEMQQTYSQPSKVNTPQMAQSLNLLRASTGLQKKQLAAMRKQYDLEERSRASSQNLATVEEQVSQLDEQRSEMLSQSLTLLRVSSGLQKAQLDAMRKRYQLLGNTSSSSAVAEPDKEQQHDQKTADLNLLRGCTGLQGLQLKAMGKLYAQKTSPVATPVVEEQVVVFPEEIAAVEQQTVEKSAAQKQAAEDLNLLRGCTGLQGRQLKAMSNLYERESPAAEPAAVVLQRQQEQAADIAFPEALAAEQTFQAQQEAAEMRIQEDLNLLRTCRGLQGRQLMAMRKRYEWNDSFAAAVAEPVIEPETSPMEKAAVVEREVQVQQQVAEDLNLLRGCTGLQGRQLKAMNKLYNRSFTPLAAAKPPVTEQEEDAEEILSEKDMEILTGASFGASKHAEATGFLLGATIGADTSKKVRVGNHVDATGFLSEEILSEEDMEILSSSSSLGPAEQEKDDGAAHYQQLIQKHYHMLAQQAESPSSRRSPTVSAKATAATEATQGKLQRLRWNRSRI